MNITAVRRGALLTALAFAALAPSASASGITPYQGTYLGETGQGRPVTLQIGPLGRVDMEVDLFMRCASGASYRTATKTDPGDHFKVGPEGRFRVAGSFRKEPEGAGLPRTAAYVHGHFRMVGRVKHHAGTGPKRIHGGVRQVDDVYDAKGRKVDQCVNYLHTFKAREGAVG